MATEENCRALLLDVDGYVAYQIKGAETPGC
jgi:hypothetical protein